VGVDDDVSGRRPRLVFVAAIVPSPQSTNGFSARVHHFLAAASDHMDVTLVWIRLPGHEKTAEPTAPGRVRTLDAPRAPWAEPGPRGRAARALVQYPFDRLPFDCYPRKWPRLREVLDEEQPAVVAFYLPYLAHLVEHAPADVPVVAVLEEGWERLVAASLDLSNRKDAWLARREAGRYARVYKRVDRRAQAVVAISAEERHSFAATIDARKIAVVPNGIDTEYFTPRETASRDIDVLVVSDLRSPRNHVGAIRAWEIANADPRSASWRWTFVGAADEPMATSLRAGGATVTGVVDDVRPYYERARAVLVPALTGTGVKSTSIQAWSMRRPLVATPVGARGLPARHGDNILVGEGPPELVDHLRAVLADDGLAERLGAAGGATARSECDLATIATGFAQLCLRAGAKAEVAA
jgi:glycosyltransferase involved in cell wall biosynthesis